MVVERFNVPGISCGHCVQAITKEVSTLQGIKNVQVELQDKMVTVEHEETLSRQSIIEAINEAGYDVSSFDNSLGLQQA